MICHNLEIEYWNLHIVMHDDLYMWTERYDKPMHMQVPKLVIIVSTDNLLLIGAATPTGNMMKTLITGFIKQAV